VERLPRVLISLVLLAFVSSCGMLKDYLARRSYAAQMLYDYTYDASAEAVWTEATATLGISAQAGTREGERRVYTAAAAPPSQDGKQHPGLKVVVEPLGDRTWLAIFRIPWGAPEIDDRDLYARDVDTELEVLRKLAPEDARRFEQGSYAAGKRAR